MSSGSSIKFRFLQLSDLRLGSNSSMNLHLPPTKRNRRSEETLEALERAIQYALEQNVDAVFMPGNLFDASEVTVRSIAALQKLFERLGEIPVYIAPGVLDPISSDSYYSKLALKAKGAQPWPENVHIFDSVEWQTVEHAGNANIRITASCINSANLTASDQPERVPPLQEQDQAALNFLLMPLQKALSAPGGESSELENSASGSGFSYVALSGPSSKLLLKAPDGRIVAGASGTFLAQSENELGPRHALAVEICKTTGGVFETNVEALEFDSRRIVEAKVNLTNRPPSSWAHDVEVAISACGAREGLDILLFRLDGVYPEGHEQVLAELVLNKNYFHVRCIDSSRPDYLNRISADNKIERGLLTIIKRLRSLETSKNEVCEEEVQVIDDALYFALEALREGKVSVRNAD